MKKIVFVFTFVLGFLTGYSQQYPVNQFIGAPTTLVTSKGAFRTDSSLILPYFSDTSKANISPYIKRYPGTLIRVKDTLYFRSTDTAKWLPLTGGGNVVINNIVNYQTRLISGAAVWDSLLIYSVTACTYYINGTLYHSAATNVTLAPANPTYPRIDVIYCDTLGNVGVITGIPAPDPVKPTVDPLSQIELTHIDIKANALTPDNTVKGLIYNENYGVPSEWNTGTASTCPINFASTSNPYSGTKSIYLPKCELGYTITLTNNTSISADTVTTLSMYLRLNSTAPINYIKTINGIQESPIFVVNLFKAGTPVTSKVLVINGNYGYNRLDTLVYQHIAIPLSDFVFLNPNDMSFDEIAISVESAPSLGMQLDYITYVTGANPPPITSNFWSLSGNDISTNPRAILGTTSKNSLSIVTTNTERINIAEDGAITLQGLGTETDTTTYKPVVADNNGLVSRMANWVGGGGNQNLQQVTDIGNTTTNDIYGEQIHTNYGVTLTDDGAVITEIISLRPLITDNTNQVVLNPANITGQKNLYLPNIDVKTLAVSVNGNYADSLGGITIPTGTGTVTQVNSGYGLSGGPINVSGTLAADTSTSGLSGKYLRIVDTTNNWWGINGNTGTTSSNFLGTLDNQALRFKVKGVASGIVDSANKNVSLGFGTLRLNTPNGASIGTYNIAIGHNALSKDTFGIQNVAIGGAALGTSTTYSKGNTVVGYAAMNQSRNSSYNTVMGWGSMARDYYGIYNTAIGADISNFNAPSAGDTMKSNTFIGRRSAWLKKAGERNVFVGDSTGASNVNGSRNVFIGSYAGSSETGSDLLYIANSGTSNPLIKGNFADSTLKINGKMSISTSSVVPDSSLDVTGGVKLRSIYSSNNSSDSMLVIKSNGGVGLRAISGSTQNGRFGNDTATVVMAKVHNDAGVALTNGQVVYLSKSGTSSDAPSVKLANNKADSTSANTFGFVSGTIANNDTGWIILSGKIEKLNTSAFANGDIIYLDSISGQWTKTKPQAPYHMVYLGAVVKANAGNGSIFVKVQNGYELDEIHDVKITSPQNNNILVYSDTQKLWKNRTIYSVADTSTVFATKSNVALKVNISDTATMLSPYAKTSAVNLKVNISDTASMLSPYQQKYQAANTFQANNTSSSANTTAQTFRDSTYKTYTGTITWTGTTAPTSVISNLYRWNQIGKSVTLYVYLSYTNSSSGLTAITLDLPTDCPTPSSWGISPTVASTFYQMNGVLTGKTSANTTSNAPGGSPIGLRRNAANSAWELHSTFGSSTTRFFWITMNYFID